MIFLLYKQIKFQHTATRRWLHGECGWHADWWCFNTQPPEGGCLDEAKLSWNLYWFQHTATRRWLLVYLYLMYFTHTVSTHSHPKVAAFSFALGFTWWLVSTHSHPKVAAKSYCRILDGDKVSTHSHPKVAACLVYLLHHYKLFQHTATRRWLLKATATLLNTSTFQHTATRRWLPVIFPIYTSPKGFNTQPPEGGCACVMP